MVEPGKNAPIQECSEHLRALLEQVPAGMCRIEVQPALDPGRPIPEQVEHLRRHARLAECNDRMALMYSRATAGDIEGTHIGEVFLRSSTVAIPQLEAFVHAGYQLSNLESRDVDPEGNLRILLHNLNGVLEDGRLVRIWGSVRDITELKRTEADNLRLAGLTHENPNPVLETDAAGFVIYLNPAVEKLLKQLRIDLTDLLPSNHTDLVRSCLEGSQPVQEVEVAVQDRVFAWTYFPVPGLGVAHLYASDISERKRSEERLLRDALHDSLTGLPNRALLNDRLERSLQRAARHREYHFAVLFLDLDRFKIVNDSLGHLVGDELLVAVAHQLETCARRQDTVARLGGDEFVILQDDLRSVADATRLAERIKDTLAAPFQLGQNEVFTSASIGIAISAAGYLRPDDLLRNADTAMYRAKASGRGRYEVFDKAMHERAVSLQRLETDLRQAIARREFVVHFQPILLANTLDLVACEALVRWKHPSRGLIPPGQFIPHAEETGLIDDIGQLVLEEACACNRDWRAAGFPHIKVSVNLSPRQFLQPDLCARIHKTLQTCGLDPSALELEITESAAAQDPESAIRVLHELRALGIHLLIDDFGTGYSSLSQLKRFPIDAIKIDQSFVHDLATESSAAAIVHAVISMAHALGFEVVAEGVEDTQQHEDLKARGCDQVQGFLFGRPVPAAEFEQTCLAQALLG